MMKVDDYYIDLHDDEIQGRLWELGVTTSINSKKLDVKEGHRACFAMTTMGDIDVIVCVVMDGKTPDDMSRKFWREANKLGGIQVYCVLAKVEDTVLARQGML